MVIHGTDYQLFGPERQVQDWLHQRTPGTQATNLHIILVFVHYNKNVLHVFLNSSELHAHCTFYSFVESLSIQHM